MSDLATEREALVLLEQLLDVPEEKRQAWIEEKTADNPVLQARLISLRNADKMESVHTKGFGALLNDHDGDDDELPERVGAYKIMERIGKGGMGSVYRGERKRGDFEHVVAIKIIKSGLFSEALVERFQRERQTLASLTHPNIAQLFDGGEMESGSPYIVMEYVDGSPLLTYCEKNAPSMKERVRLYTDICSSVAFAHRNLIVHRDITPSNILVTRDGVVKLIDFGIARLATKPGTSDSSYPSNSLASLTLTPGYSAPERRMSSDVTTAADIYSLGRLLECLLPDIQIAEIKSIIGKATRSDPVERYETVNALIEDLTRLTEGRAIFTHSSAPSYRFRKFISRHKFGTLATTAGVIALLSAFAITYMQYNNAEARFAETRELTSFLLNDIPEDLAALPGTLPAMQKITDISARYLDILAKAAKSDESIRFDYATGRAKLGVLLTAAGSKNLGKPEEGLKNFEAAIAVLTPMANKPKASVKTRLALAMAQSDLAFAEIFHFGETDRPLRLMNESSLIAGQILRELPDNKNAKRTLADNLLNSAQASLFIGVDPSKSMTRAKAQYAELLKLYPDDPAILSRYAGVLSVIGYSEQNYWDDLPGGIVTSSYRQRYRSAIRGVEESEAILNQLIRKHPVNPQYQLQYVRAVRPHVYLVTSRKEWEVGPDDRLDMLARAGQSGIKGSVTRLVKTDPRFRNLQLASAELQRKMDVSDAYLASLAPFDGQTYSHIEASFYNLRAHADIEQYLNFDIDASLGYVNQALAMTKVFTKANPDFRNAYTETADLLTQKAELLNFTQRIFGGDQKNNICSQLAGADTVWKKVETRWGPIKDYSAEKNKTAELINKHRC